MGQNHGNSASDRATLSHCTSSATLTIEGAANCSTYGGLAGLNVGLMTDNLADIVINFGDNETTRVESIDTPSSHGAEIWYTLDGRPLNGKPTARGIYVKNGRKVIITK